ncbi:LuxR C-terminal-related transcriptional regulator [Streptomyces sp. NPDC056400]|uniref:LuxR C-terminal-related transcriptional regulator n=1 Tax=Streptomyces sp. NPDC056400 TaxID=3345808 RepID=UPI0035DE526B
MAHHPDVVVMDGVSAVAEPADRGPDCKVITLTTFDDEYVGRALGAGAIGHLLKNPPPAELAAAVSPARAGVAQLDAAVARRLAAGPSRPAPPGPAPAPALSALTERETDVRRLIATGSTNREIAGRLFLSEGTVKNHISRVPYRPGLRDRTHAASNARDQSLLQGRPA